MPGRQILIVTLEPISKQMAGPAIRCVEIGKELAQRHSVTVFSPHAAAVTSSDFSPLPTFQLALGVGRSGLYDLAHRADIIFIQANVLKPYPRLSELGKYLVLDLYDPYLLSVLAQYADDRATSSSSYAFMHRLLERHMIAADFCLCASEKQLDYWLGRFCALGRLSPEMYRFDASFRKLIDVMPFGLPGTEPQRTEAGIKGKVPGIAADDFVLLWGGGIWDWFDPLSVIKAVALLVPKYPQLKLYFMGIKSPNPQVPLMKMATRAIELSKELGVHDKAVFFCDTWTPYEQRANFLLDADACVSAHFDLPETRFSFRTRILDYLWAGRPVLTTTGDQFAELVEGKRAGMAVAYENPQAWADAIETLLKSEETCRQFAEGAAALAEQFRWENVVAPLMRYCDDPHHLPEFRRIRMPSLVDRAKAVYARGGKDLVVRRSRELLKEIIRG